MFFSSKQRYDMQVECCGKQGTQFTIRRNPNMFATSMYLILGAVAMWRCLTFHQNSNTQNCVAAIALLFTTLLFMLSLRRLHTESLLIISTVGVTIQRSNLLGTNSQFFDISQIEDIVIIEAISLHSIIFQLALLPKQYGVHTKGKTFPLFLDFRPKLLDLQLIYRESQEKLFSPKLVHR